MNLGVLGASGLVGSHVVQAANARGWQVRGYPRQQAPLHDLQGLRALAHQHDVVINAAAYTAVDAAETHEAQAFAANALGAAHVAEACADAHTRLVHLSTDYVFGGDATLPYLHSDVPAPRTAYGRTKVAGEWAVTASGCSALIVRTAWLYGAGARNFPEAIKAALASRDTLEVVNDQTGNPTWAHDLSHGLLDLLSADADDGIYHLTNGGQATWFDFARALCEQWGEDPDRIRPTSSHAFPRPAPRPAWSVLDGRRAEAWGVRLRHWRESLAAASDVGVWGEVTDRPGV
ncbi:molecular chaperone DnaJ [Platysternon megacephalum]|uniref:Methionine adenosyltransferase 2 subunit beta n=1 Tax=Platysternon megacephalum TaxID=55544 RepID=A0A4D9DIS7_9SAUR|nr:molecular chaperone DnaJ [Platysternon megacephalum]